MHKVTAIAASLLLRCACARAAHEVRAVDVLQVSYPVRIAILWICAAIALAVFAVMIYSIVVFRKPRIAMPGAYHRNTFSEVVWAAVAILILVAAVVPAVKEAVVVDDMRAPDELAHAIADVLRPQP